MKGKLIIKLNEGMENCIFLSRLMQALHLNNCNYKVLKRPKKAYDLESFDGLLEVEFDKEKCNLEENLSEIVSRHKASIRAFFFYGSKEAYVKHFEAGRLISTCIIKENFVEGSLDEDLMFMTEKISINLDKEKYHKSTVHFKVIDLLSNYPFIEFQSEIDFDKNDDNRETDVSNSFILAPFFISKHQKKQFLKDLNSLLVMLKPFSLKIVGSLLGYDADLNMTSIEVVKNEIIESHSKYVSNTLSENYEERFEESN